MPFLAILRPVNFIFVFVCVLFGALFKNLIPFNLKILFAMLSAGAIAGAGYIINDFFDLQIDIVNRPDRILPSGKIRPKTAYIYSVVLFVTGIIFSYFTANLFCILLAFINSFLLFYYANYFKKKLLTGNLIVSYSAASCFVFGGFAAGNLKNSIIIAFLAFFFTMIREIIKDAEDMEGDREFGVCSIAILFGKKNAIIISVFFSLVITSLFLYSYFNEFFSSLTMLLSLFLITLPLLTIMFYLYSNIDSKHAFSKSSTLLKIDMIVLLLIVIIGN